MDFINSAREHFPFECVLSLEPLLDYLEEKLASGQWPSNPLGGDLDQALAAAPELRGHITDLAVLERHRGLLLRLMSLLFPPASWDTEVFAAVLPFVMTPFLTSPQCERLFMGPGGQWRGRVNIDNETFERGRAIKAYLFILDRFYGLSQEMDYPLAMIAEDPDTGLERHFAMQVDFRFVRVEAVGEPVELDQERLDYIKDHLSDPEALKEVLPPEGFRLTGFTTMKGAEVTVFETISALSRDLIDNEAVITRAGFDRLQSRLRTLFRRPELVAGLAAIHQDKVLLLNVGCEIESGGLFSDTQHEPLERFQGTLFERVTQGQEIVVVPDVTTDPGIQEMDLDYTEHGLRSLMIAPLIYKGECIGSLEVGLPEVDQFKPTDVALMSQLQPLFTVAV